MTENFACKNTISEFLPFSAFNRRHRCNYIVLKRQFFKQKRTCQVLVKRQLGWSTCSSMISSTL